ncbi:hypothetical protein [Paenibacillus silvae]|uniref:hypothetical protein n=1 Tax=Paenibacillus silvae TaxID=1325358 RepID=UPI00142DFFEE|nr:hypothetical protein [Paenibacillus silvae]
MLTGEKVKQYAEHKKISGAASAAPFFASGNEEMKRKKILKGSLKERDKTFSIEC